MSMSGNIAIPSPPPPPPLSVLESGAGLEKRNGFFGGPKRARVRHKNPPFLSLSLFHARARAASRRGKEEEDNSLHSISIPGSVRRSQTKPPAAFGELKRRERAELGRPPDGFSHSTLMPRFALHTVVQREVEDDDTVSEKSLIQILC